MKYNQYKYRFYLNASHSIYIDGNLGERHPHTWEIELVTLKIIEKFVQFNDIEKDMEKELERYQDQYVNDISPFDVTNPTLENICVYFKDTIQQILLQRGWVLLSIEISETPTRSYIIDLENEFDFEALEDELDNKKLEEDKIMTEDFVEDIIDDILDDLVSKEKNEEAQVKTLDNN